MSENNEGEIVISIRGKGGQSGEYKLLMLTREEILAEVRKLGSLNQQIFSQCLNLAEIEAKKLGLTPNTYLEQTKLQIALAFFEAHSVSSFTVLRSKLEKDLHER